MSSPSNGIGPSSNGTVAGGERVHVHVHANVDAATPRRGAGMLLRWLGGRGWEVSGGGKKMKQIEKV